jgi:hypothetical protein
MPIRCLSDASLKVKRLEKLKKIKKIIIKLRSSFIFVENICTMEPPTGRMLTEMTDTKFAVEGY